MKDDRIIGDFVFGEVDSKAKKDRPPRKWADDIIARLTQRRYARTVMESNQREEVTEYRSACNRHQRPGIRETEAFISESH